MENLEDQKTELWRGLLRKNIKRKLSFIDDTDLQKEIANMVDLNLLNRFIF
jgi:flagellin-like hook-associated protein FlgL